MTWSGLVAFVLGASLMQVECMRLKNKILPQQHCLVEDESGKLCWQGPVLEGRLQAMCGDTAVRGKCEADGYTCDVSGASVERFSLFLGLTLFEQPLASGLCSEEKFDLKKAMLMGSLQNNGLCPAIKNFFKSIHEHTEEMLSGQASAFTSALVGCSGGITLDKCTDAVTHASSDFFVLSTLLSWEHHFGIAWAKKIVAGVDVAKEMPEGILAFAKRLGLSVEDVHDKIKIAKQFIAKWDGFKHIAEKHLPALFRPVLWPAVHLLLKKFPEVFEDNVRDSLEHSGKLHEFQEAVKEYYEGMLDNMEKLCLFATSR